MKNQQSLKSPLSLLFISLLALGSLFFALTAEAAELRSHKSFDHLHTGFPLLGVHEQVECHTCHLQGVFKGTPRQCEYCHTQGSRIASTFKPSGHPQTNQPCTQCHTSQTTWTGARFDHTGVIPGSCANCHNGVKATGKPPHHIVTTQPCDKCHRTTAWIPAGFDHTGVVTHTCESLCHSAGGGATPRPAAPHAATGFCDDCHGTTAWLPTKNHVNVVQGQCFTCHNGTTAPGMVNSPTPHIPITTVAAGWSCDACHTYTARFSYSSFKHTSTQVAAGSNCGGCHSGGYMGMNAYGLNDAGYNHFPVLIGDCKTCHTSTVSFKTYTFNHSTQGIAVSTTTNCYQCHNGTHRFGGERLRGPDHSFVINKPAGTCANTGCHTSLRDWGSHGDNKAFRSVFKKK